MLSGFLFSESIRRMKEYHLAVIGADNRGKISTLAHQPERGFKLVAASSLNLEKMEFYRTTCGNDIRLTTDYRKIISDPSIDAVFIATPDYLHEKHSLAAIRAGKSVFLEKPMAISVKGCDRILKAAQENGVKLYVGHNMRFYPVMRKMKELIMQGAIGRVEAIWCRHFISYGGDAYFKNWNSERKKSTSLLLQKGAHDLDIIQWLAGAYPQMVVGMGKLSVYDKTTNRRSPDNSGDYRWNLEHWPPLAQTGMSPVIDVEDHNMLMLQMENGVQASYKQCHYSPDAVRNYTIIGTEGRIENFGDYSTSTKNASVHLWNKRSSYAERGNEIFEIPFVAGGHGGADPQNVEAFLSLLLNEASSGASPVDARMAVAAGCLGAESLRNGSRPKIVPSPPVYDVTAAFTTSSLSEKQL